MSIQETIRILNQMYAVYTPIANIKIDSGNVNIAMMQSNMTFGTKNLSFLNKLIRVLVIKKGEIELKK